MWQLVDSNQKLLKGFDNFNGCIDSSAESLALQMAEHSDFYTFGQQFPVLIRSLYTLVTGIKCYLHFRFSVICKDLFFLFLKCNN